MWLQVKSFFDTEFNGSNLKGKYTRLIGLTGAPIEVDGIRYRDKVDEETEQEDKCYDRSKAIMDMVELDEDPMKIMVFSETIFMSWMMDQANKDLLFAIGSLLFVMCYMSFHLRSFFLGGFAMLNIVFSFPVTLAIYRFIGRVTYYSTLHNLVVFIVLGIAADQTFVFTDAWRQSAAIDAIKNDMTRRLAYTWKRAARAIMVTASTTCVAFMATGFSDIMPISSFGIYAAIIIPVNYCLVITMYPAVLMFWEKHINNKVCTCLDGKFDVKKPEVNENMTDREKYIG